VWRNPHPCRSLDSVIFFNPRNFMVDVVQSVGRVMRKFEGKDYGYIIHFQWRWPRMYRRRRR